MSLLLLIFVLLSVSLLFSFSDTSLATLLVILVIWRVQISWSRSLSANFNDSISVFRLFSISQVATYTFTLDSCRVFSRDIIVSLAFLQSLTTSSCSVVRATISFSSLMFLSTKAFTFSHGMWSRGSNLPVLSLIKDFFRDIIAENGETWSWKLRPELWTCSKVDVKIISNQ